MSYGTLTNAIFGRLPWLFPRKPCHLYKAYRSCAGSFCPVCLVFLNGADLCVDCYKVMLCNSSGECPNYDISRLLLSGYDNSVVLYVRRLIHITGNEC